MGTNRDPNWWWRLQPGSRAVLAVTGLGAVAVLGACTIGREPILSYLRERNAAQERVQARKAEQDRRTLLAAADHVRVTVEDAYAHLDEAGVPRELHDWRRRMAELYIEMRERGDSRAGAIRRLTKLEDDEIAHRQNAAAR